MEVKNEIYDLTSTMEKLLEKIKSAKVINPRNSKLLLEYDKSMRRDELSLPRREKVIRTLFVLARLVDKPFDECKRPDIEKLVDEIESKDLSAWTKHDYKKN
jgi:hypothetical protein